MAVHKILQAPKPTPIKEIIVHESPFVGVRVSVQKGHNKHQVCIEGWDPTDGGGSNRKQGYLTAADAADLGHALINLSEELRNG